MNRWSVASFALAGLCACTAVAIVYTTHLTRASWADLGASRRAIDELAVEWSRLQIEQSTFAGHGRIERAARERLGMVQPSLEDSRLIVLREERTGGPDRRPGPEAPR